MTGGQTCALPIFQRRCAAFGYLPSPALPTDALDRVYMALDYFDASINRVSAWVVGFRSWQKALLSALCTPNAKLKELQDEGCFTELMMMHEELKTFPFGAVWDEYCRSCGLPVGAKWFEEIEKYEKEVLSKR